LKEGGVEVAVKMIEENIPSGVHYSKVYLVPSITNPLIPSYPFSYEFLG
jgi:hypothetical protein